MKVQHQQKQRGFKSQTKDGEMLPSRLFQLMSDVQSLTCGSSHYDPQLLWLDFRSSQQHARLHMCLQQNKDNADRNTLIFPLDQQLLLKLRCYCLGWAAADFLDACFHAALKTGFEVCLVLVWLPSEHLCDVCADQPASSGAGVAVCCRRTQKSADLRCPTRGAISLICISTVPRHTCGQVKSSARILIFSEICKQQPKSNICLRRDTGAVLKSTLREGATGGAQCRPCGWICRCAD